MVRELLSKNAKRIGFHGILTKTLLFYNRNKLHENRLARDMCIIICGDYGMT